MNKPQLLNHLKQLAKDQGMTYAAIGNELGVTKQHISNVLNDSGNSASDTAISKIADVLGYETEIKYQLIKKNI